MALQSFVAALACLALLYTLMPRVPRGLPRLLLLLPSLPVFVWLPFSTRSHQLRSSLTFCFLWVCPSRLLLLSWDSSPDSSLSHGFFYFVFTTVIPVRVKGRASTPASTKQVSPNIFVPNFALFLVVLSGCLYRESLPLWQIHAVYCLIVFLSLELSLAMAAKLANVLLGVETLPHSNNPIAASSLSEFWGKRWNLVASDLLRLTVYAPIRRLLSSGQGQDAVKKHANQSLAKAGKDAGITKVKTRTSSSWKESVMQTRGLRENVQPQLCDPGVEYGEAKNAARHSLPAREIAVLASFLVSGLIHELIFGCITQVQPTWEVTMFFILHGFATVLEGFVSRELPSGWKVPRPVAIFCTLGFILSTAVWLFAPPLVRAGEDVRIIAEFNHIQSVMVDLFRRQ